MDGVRLEEDQGTLHLVGPFGNAACGLAGGKGRYFLIGLEPIGLSLPGATGSEPWGPVNGVATGFAVFGGLAASVQPIVSPREPRTTRETRTCFMADRSKVKRDTSAGTNLAEVSPNLDDGRVY